MNPTVPPTSGGVPGTRGVAQRSCRRARTCERRAVERADGALGAHAGVDPGGAVAVLGQDAEAADADERPARPQAALAGGLEQERAGTPVGELAVDPDRGLAVAVERADDGDDAVAVRHQVVELRTGGRVRLVGDRRGRRGGRVRHRVAPAVSASVVSSAVASSVVASGATAVTGSSGSTSKQRCAPVWQAAPDLLHGHEQGVVVAVQRGRTHVLGVPRGVALPPVLLPRAGPEGHPPLGQGAAEGFAVHPAEHEDVLRRLLLHDCREQPVRTEARTVEDRVGAGAGAVGHEAPSVRRARTPAGRP